MQDISIIIIDDHPLFRQGVADALSIEADITIVAQAASGEQGLELIRQHHPMVAIVDVNLPGINGHQVIRQIVDERLGTNVILLTAYDDIEQKIHAMRSGAAAYCTKDVQPEKLVQVIRSVTAGKFVINHHQLDKSGLDRWIASAGESSASYFSDPSDSYQPLSAREMEVLVAVTRGMSNKEIAVNLGISHQTVKNHVTSILRKLGVEDRTQAALYALRRGWVRLHEKNDASED